MRKTLVGMTVQQKKLLEYFDLLGFNDPNVIEARKNYLVLCLNDG